MSKWAILAAFFSTTAFAGEYRILRPREVYVDMYKYQSPPHDPYLDPIDGELSHGGTFNLDLDMFKYKGYGLHWNNELFFDASDRTGKVKHGGWRYELGLTIYASDKGRARIELFDQHESRHIMEETRVEHFPVYDRYGIRFKVYP